MRTIHCSTYHTNLNIDLEEASFGLTLPVAINSLALTLPVFEYHDQKDIYVCTIKSINVIICVR